MKTNFTPDAIYKIDKTKLVRFLTNFQPKDGSQVFLFRNQEGKNLVLSKEELSQRKVVKATTLDILLNWIKD